MKKLTKEITKLNATETLTKIEEMWDSRFDPRALEGILLDQREVSKFVCSKMRLMRLMALSSGLYNLLWMIENAFYESYNTGRLSQLAKTLEHDGVDLH